MTAPERGWTCACWECAHGIGPLTAQTCPTAVAGPGQLCETCRTAKEGGAEANTVAPRMIAKDVLGARADLAATDAPPDVVRLLNMDVAELVRADWITLADYVEERADVHERMARYLGEMADAMLDDDEEGDE